jgi:dephospho-CoA kinase
MKTGDIIAITGQSGSGKSTLSRYYSSKGYTVLDCDEIAKKVHTDPKCISELAEYFGRDLIANGVLDRRMLSKRAFSSAENLQKLTEITHPYIIDILLEDAENAFKSGADFVFVDGAVIIGYEFEKYCDKFIVVTADFNIQCERIAARDGISLKEAAERIKRQTPIEYMISNADYVIYNNGTTENLLAQGELVLKKIEQNYKKHETFC